MTRTITPDALRAAIEAALRRRDPAALLLRYPTESDRALWTATWLRSEVSTRGYGSNHDLDALRTLALAVGLRVSDCHTCNGRGRRAYGRETEDGCDACECAGIVVTDPADALDAVRAELARVTAERDALRVTIRADIRCDECGCLATRQSDEVADRVICDVCTGDGEPTTDLACAAVVRGIYEAPAGESGGERE